ncbi:hypothetical protein [Nitratifractor sp.]|uniref:hypothetical protein n=1 Tax=Nitratifractor sp. TaxID=2268144 RepID=UPI0025D19078|nr:hypothetical protein [Nitratifractor sp.]
MNRISISEVQRNLHKLDDFDIVEIVDKKRNKVKGYFIESKYASLVEEIAQKVEALKKNGTQKAAGALHRYADPSKITGEKNFWKKHTIENYSENPVE